MFSRSRSSRGLRRESAAARFLGLRVPTDVLILSVVGGQVEVSASGGKLVQIRHRVRTGSPDNKVLKNKKKKSVMSDLK
jgi:hypothetical protein